MFYIIIIIILVNIISKRGLINNYYKKYNYEQIRPYLKTGDIILFAYKKYSNLIEEITYNIRTKLMGTLFGHVGIILKMNNELYVLESVPLFASAIKYSKFLNGSITGPRIVKLNTLLKLYDKKNDAYYGVKFIDKEISSKKLYNEFLTYKHIDFPNWITIAIIGCFDTLFNCGDLISKFTDKNKMMCSEFVHDILYKCNVFKKYNSKLFYPHTITSNKFDKLCNYKYSNIKLFTI
jgi:hypothetical protein